MLKSLIRGALLCALALPLAACVTADASVSRVTESQQFAAICRNEPLAHAGFVIVATQTELAPRLVRAEATAHAIVRSVCTNPPADVSSALVKAAEAYAIVLDAQASATEEKES